MADLASWAVAGVVRQREVVFAQPVGRALLLMPVHGLGLPAVRRRQVRARNGATAAP